MKYLNKFTEFDIVLENSKNDPIPELNRSKKLGIILLGAPGAGKSTFAKEFILSKNRNIKIFSTDDISYTFTKQHNTYRKGSSEINLRKLDMFMESGGSFIYDTTGVQHDNVSNITEKAREYGYDVIFIHLMVPLDTSLRQNQERERHVPNYYIKHAYERQYKNMHFFSDLKPDNYYIVYNIDGKYKFMKFDGVEILRRNVDKYLPVNYGNKYFALKESIDNNTISDNIIENVEYIFTNKIDDEFYIDIKIKYDVLTIIIKHDDFFYTDIFTEEFQVLDEYLKNLDIPYFEPSFLGMYDSFDKLVKNRYKLRYFIYKKFLR